MGFVEEYVCMDSNQSIRNIGNSWDSKIKRLIIMFLTLTLLTGIAAGECDNTYTATISGTDIPCNGTWYIYNYTSITNGIVEFGNYNNISVGSGGTLHILGNTTIRFLMVSNFTQNITVSSGGNLTIDSESGKDNYIESNNTGYYFDVSILTGSSDISWKNATFNNSHSLDIEANGTIENVSVIGNIRAPTAGFIGIEGGTDKNLTISNAIISYYDHGIAGDRSTRFNISNSTIGVGNYLVYGITHPLTGSIIENNSLEARTNNLYLDYSITAQNNICINYTTTTYAAIKEIGGGLSGTYINNSCGYHLAYANSNSEITGNAKAIYIMASPQNVNIHDINHSVNDADYRIYTKASLTVRNITGVAITKGYAVDAANIYLKIINESVSPTGLSLGHYVSSVSSYIEKYRTLTVNITDSSGVPVIGNIISTDNSSNIQNNTNASYTTIDLPYKRWSVWGPPDNLSQSETYYNNYTISVTNASYSASPYTNNTVNMSENRVINIDMGSLDTNYIPPTPTLTCIQGNFYKNCTATAGVGNITNGYNFSVNGTFVQNGTLNYYNASLPALGTGNFSVYAYNSSGNGTLSLTAATNNTTLDAAPSTPSSSATGWDADTTAVDTFESVGKLLLVVIIVAVLAIMLFGLMRVQQGEAFDPFILVIAAVVIIVVLIVYQLISLLGSTIAQV